MNSRTRGPDASGSARTPDAVATRYGLLDRWHAYGAAAMDDAVMRSDLKVLWAIADHTNADGISWPSMRTLARITGIGRGNISRSIKRLRDAGYVDVVTKGTWHGASSRYMLTLKGVERIKSRRGQEATGVDRDDSHPGIAADGTPVIQTDDTLPSTAMQSVITGDAKVSSALMPNPTTDPASKAGDVEDGGMLQDGRSAAAFASAPETRSDRDDFSVKPWRTKSVDVRESDETEESIAKRRLEALCRKFKPGLPGEGREQKLKLLALVAYRLDPDRAASIGVCSSEDEAMRGALRVFVDVKNGDWSSDSVAMKWFGHSAAWSDFLSDSIEACCKYSADLNAEDE